MRRGFRRTMKQILAKLLSLNSYPSGMWGVDPARRRTRTARVSLEDLCNKVRATSVGPPVSLSSWTRIALSDAAKIWGS